MVGAQTLPKKMMPSFTCASFKPLNLTLTLEEITKKAINGKDLKPFLNHCCVLLFFDKEVWSRRGQLFNLQICQDAKGCVSDVQHTCMAVPDPMDNDKLNSLSFEDVYNTETSKRIIHHSLMQGR